jgi:alkylated DNA repair dioxygenase AlkB
MGMSKSRPLQASLFDHPSQAPQDLPDGMVYRPDFVDAQEERALIAWLETLPFKPFVFQGFEARRHVVSYGFRYDFSRSQLEEADGVPDELRPLRAKAAGLARLPPEALQQVLINKYEPGAPIGWHRDRAVFAEVVGVSLGAPCTFRLRRRLDRGFERKSLILEPRSAYLLAGPARDQWEHSIPPVEALRYSVTFRNFRDGRGRAPVAGER